MRGRGCVLVYPCWPCGLRALHRTMQQSTPPCFVLARCCMCVLRYHCTWRVCVWMDGWMGGCLVKSWVDGCELLGIPVPLAVCCVRWCCSVPLRSYLVSVSCSHHHHHVLFNHMVEYGLLLLYCSIGLLMTQASSVDPRIRGISYLYPSKILFCFVLL